MLSLHVCSYVFCTSMINSTVMWLSISVMNSSYIMNIATFGDKAVTSEAVAEQRIGNICIPSAGHSNLIHMQTSSRYLSHKLKSVIAILVQIIFSMASSFMSSWDSVTPKTTPESNSKSLAVIQRKICCVTLNS